MIGQAPPRCNQCVTTLGQLDQGEDGYAFSEGVRASAGTDDAPVIQIIQRVAHERPEFRRVHQVCRSLWRIGRLLVATGQHLEHRYAPVTLGAAYETAERATG